MERFFGITPGEEREAPGIRVRVSPEGDRVWMHGKWLDLGQDHAVAWIEGDAEFERPDGRRLKLGGFPGWIVRGTGRKPVLAIMFNIGQFIGGFIHLKGRDGVVRHYPVSADAIESGTIAPWSTSRSTRTGSIAGSRTAS